MNPPMTCAMTCAEAEPLLPLVADGAVDPSSDPDLFAHLAACPACQRAVAEHDLITLALERGAIRGQPRRARLITLPRLAAAAVLAIALGATAWSLRTPPHGLMQTPVAELPPVVQPTTAIAAKPPAPAVAAEAPTVLRVQRTDGSTLFLVRRGEAWVPVDPGQFDGSDSHTPANGGDVPVRW